jgi:hypothetical protein
VTSKDGKMEMLITAAKEAGFTCAAPLKTETLRFLPEVRELCNQDRCHHYNTNWMSLLPAARLRSAPRRRSASI